MYPSYLNLYKNGVLAKRVESAYKLLKKCCLCPRKCGVDRLKNELGHCKTGKKAYVSSYFLHHGEEPPISGFCGSGTIFFSYCNLNCVYCQNFRLSQEGEGREIEESELAHFMLELQKIGAHNINLVTPTHVMPQILKALLIATESGLKIPIVYNTGGYELVSVLKLLDGIVDVYLTDMRYAEDDVAEKYSNAPGYPSFNQQAVIEMYRQVGPTKIAPSGIIENGVVIRYLVLPNKISGTEKILSFIKNKVSDKCYISLMSQYSPYYKADKYPLINRRITSEEYEDAINIMKKLGLSCGWLQESRGIDRFAGPNIRPNV